MDRLNENPELSEYFALLVDDMLNGFTVPEYKAGCPDFHPLTVTDTLDVRMPKTCFNFVEV